MLELIQSAYANANGTGMMFNDITGATSPTAYSKNGNINYADVDAVRIRVALFENMIGATSITYGNTFTQFVEYVKTAGTTSLINGKYLSAGDYFVPQTANIAVPVGDTWLPTGYYVPQILFSWLPTAAQIPLSLSLAQINQPNNTILSDGIYTINYEVYKDSFTGSQAAVIGTQYMVISGSSTYQSSTYYPGEVFIATVASNIISSGNIVIMDATSTGFHIITYTLISSILLLLQRESVRNNVVVQDQVYDIRVELEALYYSASTNNLSYTYATDLIQRLTDSVALLIANN
jgi:hypothetical protein